MPLRTVLVAAILAAAGLANAVNAAAIHAALADAGAGGARVLLTPECALPGYPSAARGDRQRGGHGGMIRSCVRGSTCPVGTRL